MKTVLTAFIIIFCLPALGQPAVAQSFEAPQNALALAKTDFSASSLVGTWYFNENGESGYVTFNGDLTGYIERGGKEYFTYRLLDENTTLVFLSVKDVVRVEIVSFDEEQLVLRNKDGNMITYTPIL